MNEQEMLLKLKTAVCSQCFESAKKAIRQGCSVFSLPCGEKHIIIRKLDSDRFAAAGL